ncbi:hypothetical protein MTR_7g014910 [Medicago truncatula]|uniref:Uncharacterized protein n=1 Tax=Medicago truncatula TaxID=3880 RepID=A0A072TW38_MEDTR|nr:hypothetical protein MTR_7g014910 [Medicago truncatula]
MAQNHYQWTSERAIAAVAPSSFKKEARMYEAYTLDHLNAKVDTLFKKFDKLSISFVTTAPVSPPCEVCGIFGHTKQLNYAQYNQGMRPNQNFYKTPQNPFGQTAPPGYANNQDIPKKSSLELLLKNYLTLKVDSIATHNKMLETQLSQVDQQVATSSQTPGVFQGQTEANPKGLINAIILRDGKKLEDPVFSLRVLV